MNSTTTTPNQIEFTRVNNDVNGNARFVCHFYNLISKTQQKSIREEIVNEAQVGNGVRNIVDAMYSAALVNARKLGGKRFHNKQYGGGIVFQRFAGSLEGMSAKINEILQEIQ